MRAALTGIRGRVGLGLALAALLAGCGLFTTDGGSDGGTGDHGGRVGYPLGGPPPNGFARAEKVGSTFSNGQLIVFNLGSKDITLRKVDVEYRGSGLRLLGSGRGPGSSDRLDPVRAQVSPKDPDFGHLSALEGFVMPPGTEPAKRGYEIVLGFEVTTAARTTVRAVRITYDYDGDQHSQKFVSTMAICAQGLTSEKCPQEYG